MVNNFLTCHEGQSPLKAEKVAAELKEDIRLIENDVNQFLSISPRLFPLRFPSSAFFQFDPHISQE